MARPPKRSEVVNNRLMKVAEMLCRGVSQSQISRELGVCKGTISRDVDFIEEEWRQRFARDLDVHKARILTELAYVRAQAWHEWDRSRKNAETVVEKMKKDDEDGDGGNSSNLDEGATNDGNLIPACDILNGPSIADDEPEESLSSKRSKWAKNSAIRERAKKHGLKPFSLTRTLRGREGDPAYLKIIVDTLAKESDVLGLTVHKIAPVDPSGTTAYGEHMMNEMMRMSESLQRGPLVTTDDVIEANVIGHIESKPSNASDYSHGQGDELPALNEGELSNIFGGLLGGLDGSEGDTDVSGEVEEKAKK